jgi:acyl carrier protein
MKLPLNEETALLFVRSLIQQTSGTSIDSIGQYDNLITDLALDSIELIDLLMQLEENGIVIHESQINARLTVNSLIQCFMTAPAAAEENVKSSLPSKHH